MYLLHYYLKKRQIEFPRSGNPFYHGCSLPKLALTKVNKVPNLNLVIDLIPLGLWQLKTEFENSLINFRILFLIAGKVLEFLIFKSKLFNDSWWKKRIYKKIMFTTKEGNLTISSYITCFANARKYSEEIFRKLPLKYFEKVADFSIPSFFSEWF